MQHCRKGPRGPDQVGRESPECALAEGQPCPGAHQAQHHQPEKGGDGPSLLCAGTASSQVLGELWVTQHNKHKTMSTQRRATRMMRDFEGEAA